MTHVHEIIKRELIQLWELESNFEIDGKEKYDDSEVFLRIDQKTGKTTAEVFYNGDWETYNISNYKRNKKMINLENCSSITIRIHKNIKQIQEIKDMPIDKIKLITLLSEEISELIRIIDPKLGEDLDALYAMQELVDKLYHE